MNGSKSARNQVSIINRSNVCGGVKKVGIPSRIGFFMRNHALNRAPRTLPKTCVPLGIEPTDRTFYDREGEKGFALENPQLTQYRKTRTTELTTVLTTKKTTDLTALKTKYTADCLAIDKNKTFTTLTKIKRKSSITTAYNMAVIGINNVFKIEIASLANYVPAKLDVRRTSIKKALLIGISYEFSEPGVADEDKQTPVMIGCLNDVDYISSDYLSDLSTNITKLTDASANTLKPTTDNIYRSLYSVDPVLSGLFASNQSGDTVFLYFSGHGTNTPDKFKPANSYRPIDESDTNDECIVSSDLVAMPDDFLRLYIDNYFTVKGVTLFAIFDSCNSGTMLDLRYTYTIDSYTENKKIRDTVGNVVMISGCLDKELSEDSGLLGPLRRGVMTWAFLECIKTPDLTWRKLLGNIIEMIQDNLFDQTPVLSSGKFINIDDPIQF